MVVINENLHELFNDADVLVTLLNIGIEIKKQKNDAGIKSNQCYINYDDNRVELDSCIRKLIALNIIHTTQTTLGYRITLLKNKYLSIYDPPKEQLVKVKPTELPKNRIETDMLLGLTTPEVDIMRPEIVLKGVPKHLLHGLTENEKLKYFVAVKLEIKEDTKYYEVLSAHTKKQVNELLKEFEEYCPKRIWEGKIYLDGVRAVKAVFKNHCLKKYIKMPEKSVKLAQLEKDLIEEMANKEKYKVIYKKFVSAYFRFHTEILKNPPPRYAGKEGRAMKEVINYFLNACGNDSEKAIISINLLFDNWKRKLAPYYQSMVSINMIASRITEIINDYKNGKTSYNKGEQRLEQLRNL